MRILIDIGHPAHVHYFRNFIKIMEKKGHKFLIVARDRGIIKDLLEFYQIDFVNRGKGENSLLGKFFYMLIADYRIFKKAKEFKPDLFLSFSSPYASQVAYILKKSNIILNDTEHTDKMHSKFTYPFATSILTPTSYLHDLGVKQVRFDNVVENFYLHNRINESNDNRIRKVLRLAPAEEYLVIRMVSWKAHHDYGESGIDIKTIRGLIKEFKDKYKIFISTEDEVPSEFKKYQIVIPPYQMHSVLRNATLFIGESATMASESAILGTYAVYINSLPLMGYLKLEEKWSLLKYFSSNHGVIEYVINMLKDPDFKRNTILLSKEMQKGLINPTDFLIHFIENISKRKESQTH